MKHCFYSRQAFITVILVALITLVGCKENTLINSKISPSSNAIGVFDTSLNCITHTYYGDTSITSTNISGLSVYQVVGNYLDPFFGSMSGSTFFQVVPLDVNSTLLDSVIVDSVVMVLPYSGFTYGDTASQTATQTYQVFYMAEPIAYDSTYYSFTTKAVDATFPLSDPVTINVHALRDSFGYTVVPANYPGLRIKLKPNYINSLLKKAQQSLAGSTDPLNTFISKFNGICVRPADTRTNGAAIPYFQLDGSTIYSEAGLLVYYRNSTTDTSHIEPYYFSQASCGHFNNIAQSYSHYPVNSLYTSRSANDDIIALQNLPGAAIDVVIPGISHLPTGIICKAELQLVVLPGYGNSYSIGSDSASLIPQKIYPQGIGINNYPPGIISGLEYNLADYYPLGSTSPLGVLDGYVHPITRNGTTVYAFTIDIPREVMASAKAGNDTLHMHVNGTFEYYAAYHLVAGGATYPDALYRPKLFVVYSKLSN